MGLFPFFLCSCLIDGCRYKAQRSPLESVWGDTFYKRLPECWGHSALKGWFQVAMAFVFEKYFKLAPGRSARVIEQRSRTEARRDTFLRRVVELQPSGGRSWAASARARLGTRGQLLELIANKRLWANESFELLSRLPELLWGLVDEYVIGLVARMVVMMAVLKRSDLTRGEVVTLGNWFPILWGRFLMQFPKLSYKGAKVEGVCTRACVCVCVCVLCAIVLSACACMHVSHCSPHSAATHIWARCNNCCELWDWNQQCDEPGEEVSFCPSS